MFPVKVKGAKSLKLYGGSEVTILNPCHVSDARLVLLTFCINVWIYIYIYACTTMHSCTHTDNCYLHSTLLFYIAYNICRHNHACMHIHTHFQAIETYMLKHEHTHADTHMHYHTHTHTHSVSSDKMLSPKHVIFLVHRSGVYCDRTPSVLCLYPPTLNPKHINIFLVHR